MLIQAANQISSERIASLSPHPPSAVAAAAAAAAAATAAALRAAVAAAAAAVWGLPRACKRAGIQL